MRGLKYSLVCFTVATVLAGGPSSGKRDYECQVVKTEQDKDSKDYVKDCNINTERLSRTTTAITGKCTLKKDIPLAACVNIEGFEFNTNGGKFNEKTSVDMQRPVCEFINNDALFYQDLLKVSNFPNACPVKAGNYEIKNFTLSSDKMPEKVPSDIWRFDICAYSGECKNSAKMFCSSIYINFIRNQKSKNKSSQGGDIKGKKGKQG